MWKKNEKKNKPTVERKEERMWEYILKERNIALTKEWKKKLVYILKKKEIKEERNRGRKK